MKECQLLRLMSQMILLPVALTLGLVRPTQQISICASYPLHGKVSHS